MVTGLARYAYGYHYSPQVAPLFSNDLRLLPADTKELVVSEDQKAFYTAVASYRDGLSVVTAPTSSMFVVTRDAREGLDAYQITRIITNGHTNDSDRLYIMQRV